VYGAGRKVSEAAGQRAAERERLLDQPSAERGDARRVEGVGGLTSQ
jgi:hypothetical protein